MGILKMSPVDWVTRVMDFSQTSLENTLDTVKEVHQTLAEIPINVAQELGMSKETSAALKYTHRRLLDRIDEGVRSSVREVNQYVVKQVHTVDKLANFDKAESGQEVAPLTSENLSGGKERPEEIQLN